MQDTGKEHGYRLKLNQVQREFLKSLAFDIGFGVILSLPLSAALYFGKDIVCNRDFYMSALLLFFCMAWVVNLTKNYMNLPRDLVFQLFEAIIRGRERIGTLIEARFHRKVGELQDEITALTGQQGEEWTSPGQRIAVAIHMIRTLKPNWKYWATFTDAPYSVYERERQFLNAQTVMRHCDARRLLVYPLADLLEALNNDAQRARVKQFLQLHDEYSIELRYWAASIEELHREMHALIGKEPILLDMAIVQDVVFGQAAQEGDHTSVTGKGYILDRQSGLVELYEGAFNTLWTRRDSLYSQQQLAEFIELHEMRKTMAPATQTMGDVFFAEVVQKITTSRQLWAIDIAPTLDAWIRDTEYHEFLEASCAAAIKNPGAEFARIFVIGQCLLSEHKAQAFIETVYEPLVRCGFNVYMMRAEKLVENNLAAFDCIFSTEWGFYLLPLQPFKKADLSNQNNVMAKERIGEYRHLFTKLLRYADQREKGKTQLTDARRQHLVQYLTPGRADERRKP